MGKHSNLYLVSDSIIIDNKAGNWGYEQGKAAITWLTYDMPCAGKIEPNNIEPSALMYVVFRQAGCIY